MRVISDSTPLIHMSAVADLGLLHDLFHEITVPVAVFHEVVTPGKGRAGGREVDAAIGLWIQVEQQIPPSVTAIMRGERLQVGEAQGIALALATKADLLLVDERRAVDYVRSAGVTVMRTGTVYVAAKRAGLIGSVRGRLDGLRAARFWLSEGLPGNLESL